jgi:hypothetical protein
MGRMMFIFIASTLVVMFGITIVGCSSGPSTKQAEDAIWNYIQDHQWRYDNPADIEIVKIGKPIEGVSLLGSQVTNDPVKARLIYNIAHSVEEQFIIGQDSYGEWRATGF